MSVSIVLIEKIGRRPLLLAALTVPSVSFFYLALYCTQEWYYHLFVPPAADMAGIVCMGLADALSPSIASGYLGFFGALLLTTAIVLGMYKIPVLYTAEICPQGARYSLYCVPL